MLEVAITGLSIFVPLGGAVIAWLLNERSKRAAQEYARKEQKYLALIDALEGFYVHTKNPKRAERRATFLRELNRSWLYCPDEVISKAYAFLDTTLVGARVSDEERERLLGDLVIALRTDLLSRRITKLTKLGANDFRHLRLVEGDT